MSERRIVEVHVVVGEPPNFDAIWKVFPGALKPGVVFCYGDTIYNPSNIQISSWLAAHEEVHMKQQRALGGAMPWWERYLADAQFRIEQEVPAHVVEYDQWCIEHGERNMRRVGLKKIADRLSGPLYGNMMTFAKAKTLIKEGPL